MAQPQEIELHEAVLEYLTSTADMSIITMKTLKIVLEGRFGCDLEASKSVLKKSMHAFIDNLVGKDEDGGESNGEQRNTLKRKQIKGGLMTPVQLSDDLSAFMGLNFCPRTDVTKRVWAYIKGHNLQNPEDRREILCDATLERLFKKKKFGMFKMSKYLCDMMSTQHEDHTNNNNTIGAKSKKAKKADAGPPMSPASKAALKLQTKLAAALAKREQKKKDAKKIRKEKKLARATAIANGEEVAVRTSGGLHKMMKLSDALSSLLGVQEDSRAQVVSKLWVYIKSHHLQDPSDKRNINLDPAMTQVFGTDKLTMFSLNKVLTAHLTATNVKSEEVDGSSSSVGKMNGNNNGNNSGNNNGNGDGNGNQMDEKDGDDDEDEGEDDEDEEEEEDEESSAALQAFALDGPGFEA